MIRRLRWAKVSRLSGEAVAGRGHDLHDCSDHW